MEPIHRPVAGRLARIPISLPSALQRQIFFPMRRALVRSAASPNAAQPVERAPRVGIVVGLLALMLEGTFAILSLAAVAFIALVFFVIKQFAISGRASLGICTFGLALFLPKKG
jgi:hypothetical protein